MTSQISKHAIQTTLQLSYIWFIKIFFYNKMNNYNIIYVFFSSVKEMIVDVIYVHKIYWKTY